MITVTQVQQDMAMAEKRRKDKKDRERETGPEASPMTSAHEVAEAEMAEMDKGKGPDEKASRKAISDIGCTDGPGVFGQPGSIEPGDFQRGPLDAGHAAVSPQHAPPNASPVPPQGRGILEPLPQSAMPVVVGKDGPIMRAMAQHQARAGATVPRMPVPGGAA